MLWQQQRKLQKLGTVARFKRQREETQDPKLKKELDEEAKKMDAKIAGLEKMKAEAKMNSQKYQVELDQKSKEEIKDQSKQTEKAEKEVQKAMTEALAKQASIEKALNTERPCSKKGSSSGVKQYKEWS